MAVFTPVLAENFLAASDEIKEESTIYTAAGHGKYGWVNVDDIAEAGVDVLLDESIPCGTEILITGPELFNGYEVGIHIHCTRGNQ